MINRRDYLKFLALILTSRFNWCSTWQTWNFSWISLRWESVTWQSVRANLTSEFIKEVMRTESRWHRFTRVRVRVLIGKEWSTELDTGLWLVLSWDCLPSTIVVLKNVFPTYNGIRCALDFFNHLSPRGKGS